MLRHERNAPIWLFSFVDLAFLLLIAFTQIGLRPEAGAVLPAIGEIEIPRLETPAAPRAGGGDPIRWQLRVHPTDASRDASAKVFELVEAGRPGTRIDATDLASRLARIHERSPGKPILAPHRDSRSEDLLVAVGLLATVWGGQRTVAVQPGVRVAAGPIEIPADVAR